MGKGAKTRRLLQRTLTSSVPVAAAQNGGWSPKKGQGLGAEHSSSHTEEFGDHPAGGEDFHSGSRMTTDPLRHSILMKLGKGRRTEKNDSGKWAQLPAIPHTHSLAVPALVSQPPWPGGVATGLRSSQ